MSTTTILALSTPIVAIAGYIFVYRSASRDRVAARELARDSRDHEIDVRRRERAYEARKEAYRIVLKWARVTMQQVLLTDMVWKEAGTPDPPENVSQELFDTMNIEVAAFGSPEVKLAILEFRDAADAFSRKNSLARRAQEQDEGDEAIKALTDRDRARLLARDRFDELEADINRDLATL